MPNEFEPRIASLLRARKQAALGQGSERAPLRGSLGMIVGAAGGALLSAALAVGGYILLFSPVNAQSVPSNLRFSKSCVDAESGIELAGWVSVRLSGQKDNPYQEQPLTLVRVANTAGLEHVTLTSLLWKDDGIYVRVPSEALHQGWVKTKEGQLFLASPAEQDISVFEGDKISQEISGVSALDSVHIGPGICPKPKDNVTIP